MTTDPRTIWDGLDAAERPAVRPELLAAARQLDEPTKAVILALVNVIERQGEMLDLLVAGLKDVARLDELTHARCLLLDGQLQALLAVFAPEQLARRGGGDR